MCPYGQDKDMPAELKSYNPWEDCRFSLQMKKGRLVRNRTQLYTYFPLPAGQTAICVLQDIMQ